MCVKVPEHSIPSLQPVTTFWGGQHGPPIGNTKNEQGTWSNLFQATWLVRAETDLSSSFCPLLASRHHLNSMFSLCFLSLEEGSTALQVLPPLASHSLSLFPSSSRSIPFRFNPKEWFCATQFSSVSSEGGVPCWFSSIGALGSPWTQFGCALLSIHNLVGSEGGIIWGVPRQCG